MKCSSRIFYYRDKVLSGKSINLKEAKELFLIPQDSIYYLMLAAREIRKKFLGDKINLCAITSARSGACSEDCAFCAQSSRHKTNIPVYPLLSVEEVFRRARLAKAIPAGYFCIVTSGRMIKGDKDFKKICQMIFRIKKSLKINVDASLGELTLDQAKALKDSGLLRYNHNLETARSLYPKVCTTHSYTDRLATIGNVKKSGLELCSGGIFGMGETDKERLELFFALRELNPECIPINFLNPIAGTKIATRAGVYPKRDKLCSGLTPLEFLRIVAIARFLFPKKEIKVCGGREANLRSLQPFLFLAGANSIIIGDYLTTSGNPPSTDLKMIEDLGLHV